jgi:formate dehydrogenase major subunit
MGRRAKEVDGDVPDYPPTMEPRDPKAWGPFIMNSEGVGRLFSASMLDGPLPEHYEPMESPIQNPLHPGQSGLAGGVPVRQGGGTAEPLRHRRRVPVHRNELPAHRARALRDPARAAPHAAPALSVRRGSRELASEKGIKSGDRVRVASKRGKLEVAAIVTKRLGAMTVAGKKVYHIGIPIHWGFVGIAADRDPTKGANWLANALTPFVGDGNSRTPEFKSFLVNIEKI